MTGTGTKDDPFVVDCWADYQSVYGAEVYIEWDGSAEEKIVDFDEIKPDGFTETVKISPYTTFNGWTFVNFFSTATSYPLNFGNKSATVENFTFVNFYWQPSAGSSAGYFLYSNTSGSLKFKDCSFSGRIQVVNGKKYFTSSACEFNENALNIVVNSEKDFTLFGGEVKNSDIVADISAPTVTLCAKSAVNSRFSGKIESENAVGIGSATSAYNVYNLATDAPLSYQGKGISLYNSGISAPLQSAEEMAESEIVFKGCSAEQLKNSSYLYNIHFPIGVD